MLSAKVSFEQGATMLGVAVWPSAEHVTFGAHIRL